VVLGLSADSAYDDYLVTDVQTRDDARRANNKFDSAETQGIVANVLLPAGAVVLGVGATLLVLDLSADESDSAAMRLGVATRPGGAMVSWTGTFGGDH
jgi:hypothetical protein